MVIYDIPIHLDIGQGFAVGHILNRHTRKAGLRQPLCITTNLVDQQTFDEQFIWSVVPSFDSHVFVRLVNIINWDNIYIKFNKYYQPTGRNALPEKSPCGRLQFLLSTWFYFY